MEDTLEVLTHPFSSMPPLEVDSFRSHPSSLFDPHHLHHSHSNNNKFKSIVPPNALLGSGVSEYSLFENDLLEGRLEDQIHTTNISVTNNNSTDMDYQTYHNNNNNNNGSYIINTNNNYPSYYSTSLHSSSCSSISSSSSSMSGSTNSGLIINNLNPPSFGSPLIKYEGSPILEATSPLMLAQTGPAMPSILLNIADSTPHNMQESSLLSPAPVTAAVKKEDSIIQSNDNMNTNAPIFEQIKATTITEASVHDNKRRFSKSSTNSSPTPADADADSDSDSAIASMVPSSSSSTKKRRVKRGSNSSSTATKNKTSKKRKNIEEHSGNEDGLLSNDDDKNNDLLMMDALNGVEEEPLNLTKEELSQLTAEERAEYKRLQRLQRNRASAQLSRERKKAYMRALEKQVKELSKVNSSLSNQLSSLSNENDQLKQKLQTIEVKQKLEYSSSSEELTSPPLSPDSMRDNDSDHDHHDNNNNNPPHHTSSSRTIVVAAAAAAAANSGVHVAKKKKFDLKNHPQLARASAGMVAFTLLLTFCVLSSFAGIGLTTGDANGITNVQSSAAMLENGAIALPAANDNNHQIYQRAAAGRHLQGIEELSEKEKTITHISSISPHPSSSVAASVSSSSPSSPSLYSSYDNSTAVASVRPNTIDDQMAVEVYHRGQNNNQQ